ncbi:Oidioi.mRNA.OKI2018_I69.PAR.g10310.t1.cds [Oikopleura dioica]|uniref:Oidioi.mRNA.OKI2018_I69.PAR.g10310.t1.cds n=1 Tax=Oikopleura dioica TaxID=34765 RepID=A0ABN7RUD9_OIKDI|nr:Oidioi.mRNA.OKI2018_I69.PAR.g10310.t1.cds [Oikopleura dioica]
MYDGYSLQDALMRHAHAKQGLPNGGRVPFLPGIPGLSSSWEGFNPLAQGASNAHRPFHVQHFLKQAAAAQQQLQRKLAETSSHLKSPPRSSTSSFPEIPSLPAPFRAGLSADLDTPNGKKRRGNYASYTPQQRIEIGAFSIEYGTGKASKQFALPESTARGFRDKLMKILQDGSEGIPLEPERISRLRVLIETNTSLSGGSGTIPSPTLPSTTSPSKIPALPAPHQLFRPHLEFLENTSKLNDSNASIKIEDVSSDADSGHSSANSSNSEAKKSPSQTNATADMRSLLDKLQSYNRLRTESLERNYSSILQPNASIVGQKRSCGDEALDSDHAAKRLRLPSQTLAHSSPDQKKAIRRALYQDNTAPNPSGCGTSELDASVQIDSHFGMSARTAAKMVVTHAPSDISSIQGDLTDLTERDCQTPTSDISVESEEKPVNQVEQNQDEKSAPASVAVEIGDSEASKLLGQIEESLDKVTGAVTQRPASFTARLLATQTQLVKFVADCEVKILDESKERMKLAMEVDQMKKSQIKQAQLIDVLTKELMATSNKVEALENSAKNTPNDPVGNTVGDLVSLLKKPENMQKMTEQKPLPKMTTLDVDDCDIAALVDAIGDQMSKQK